MITFRGGPADGVSLALSRAPMLLRVVQAKDGTWDALDKLDDFAKGDESIHVYRKRGECTFMHVDGVRGGRRCGWTTCHGQYAYVAEQPGDAHTRHNPDWQRWAQGVKDAELARQLADAETLRVDSAADGDTDLAIKAMVMIAEQIAAGRKAAGTPITSAEPASGSIQCPKCGSALQYRYSGPRAIAGGCTRTGCLSFMS